MSMNSQLRFRKDGTFRVLQLADIQDGPEVSQDAIDLIEAAIEESDPDLVVLTGDQIRGYDPAYLATFRSRHDSVSGEDIPLGIRLESVINGGCDGSKSVPDPERALEDSRRKVLSTFQQFLAPIVSRGIPFAATYGNHDFQCGVSIDEQDDMYRSFTGCLNPVSQSGDGHHNNEDSLVCETGTFCLPISSSTGSQIAMGLMMVNSGDFAPQGGYGSPSAQAIEWLSNVEEAISAQSDTDSVPSLVFQHIPVPEYYRCLNKVSPFTWHAVEGYRAFSDACYTLNQEVCRPGGILGEGPCCSEENVGEFQQLQDTPGYFAMFSGHDHKNAFIGNIDGIDLGYAPTCGFCSYGPKASDRALRLLVFSEDDPAGYDSRLLTYGNLVARRPRHPLRVLVGEYMVSGMPSLRDMLRNPKIAVGVLVVAMSALKVWCRAWSHKRLSNRTSYKS